MIDIKKENRIKDWLAQTFIYYITSLFAIYIQINILQIHSHVLPDHQKLEFDQINSITIGKLVRNIIITNCELSKKIDQSISFLFSGKHYLIGYWL